MIGAAAASAGEPAGIHVSESGTSQIRTPLGQKKASNEVSLFQGVKFHYVVGERLERCPHLRGVLPAPKKPCTPLSPLSI